MPVGPVTGEPVANLLISSDAATTQAQTSEKQSEMPFDPLLEQIKSGELDSKAARKAINKLSMSLSCLVNSVEDEKETNQEQLEKSARLMEEALGKEPLNKSRSRDGKRKTRDEGSSERSRSSSDKRKRDDKHKSREKSREEDERTTRENHPPHKGTQPFKSRTNSNSEPAWTHVSRKNGSHK